MTASSSVDKHVISCRITVDDYLAGGETNRPQELAFGILREPAAPGWDHQLVVGNLFACLKAHTGRFQAGRVIMAPFDVILDRQRALVVQPDLLFVSADRLHVCSDQVWGAPDLVVEVLSHSNRRHDCRVKVGWYCEYGVRECWLVDPLASQVEVLDFVDPDIRRQIFDDGELVKSDVLPRLRLPVSRIFSE